MKFVTCMETINQHDVDMDIFMRFTKVYIHKSALEHKEWMMQFENRENKDGMIFGLRFC